jgi:phenylpyruvate tautomerase PptA (4-oxalocrotonate tautomerase family)
MPHLQFELNFTPSDLEKRRFARAVVEHFSSIMGTGVDHIAITFRSYARDDLVFGRAERPESGIAFLNADIRRGRSEEQKRQLALAIISELNAVWSIPTRSIYVVYTEHDGENFQLEDGVLPSWAPGDVPLASGGNGNGNGG